MGAICNVCKGDMLKVNGCKAKTYLSHNKKYDAIKSGGVGDFIEDEDPNNRCGDCGAKHGHFHHPGCDCERCPVCTGQLITCNCRLIVVY